MNLRNRLKKLERAGDDSTVCECYPQRNVEIYFADLSKKSNTSEPVLSGEPVPDICPDCRKPIEKQQIIIQGVDGTTQDRFPEQWQANNK